MDPKRIIKLPLLMREVAFRPKHGGEWQQARIIDETKHTFRLDTQKTIIKRTHIFRLTAANRTVEVDGDVLARLPEERIRLKG